MGARLPPSATERPPARLPDGSESQHHGGSFGAYMAHKERKLQVTDGGGRYGSGWGRGGQNMQGLAPSSDRCCILWLPSQL